MDGRPNRRNKAAFSNSSGLKSVFEKLRFRDGLVWTVGLTDDKAAFSNSSGLKSVFEKLRFRDGLVWTVGLTDDKSAFSNFSSIVRTELPQKSSNLVYARGKDSPVKCRKL